MKKYAILSMGLYLSLQVNSLGAEDFEDKPKLIVQGEASIFQPSDQMEATLGVVTGAETSDEALSENNRLMHQVVAGLQGVGLDKSDYQTGTFRIQPIYQKSSKDPEENVKGKIVRYEVSNAVHVKTQKIALADKIISAAVKGGANQVEHVNFNLNSPEAYRGAAIELAAKNALADATALASAAGVKLRNVLSLSLNHWTQSPSTTLFRSAVKGVNASSSEGAPDAISPGKTEIHAVVNIIYEIGD